MIILDEAHKQFLKIRKTVREVFDFDIDIDKTENRKMYGRAWKLNFIPAILWHVNSDTKYLWRQETTSFYTARLGNVCRAKKDISFELKNMKK